MRPIAMGRAVRSSADTGKVEEARLPSNAPTWGAYVVRALGGIARLHDLAPSRSIPSHPAPPHPIRPRSRTLESALLSPARTGTTGLSTPDEFMRRRDWVVAALEQVLSSQMTNCVVASTLC